MARMFVFVVWLLGAPLLAQPTDSDPRCELIIGDWEGVYIYDGNGFPTESYRFHGSYDENGLVMIDFTFFNFEEEDRHEGYWTCEDGVLITRLTNGFRRPILFQYEILNISRTEWTYRLISQFPNPPTFEAQRTPPSAMVPQFLDDLPPDFFERQFPPDL